MANVLVTGSFDVLHSGHVRFLEEAAKYGNLFVGVGPDSSIKKMKRRKTICSQDERLYLVRALKYVKDAWINEGDGVMDFIENFKNHDLRFIDTFIVNYDTDTKAKRQFCKEFNLRYIILHLERNNDSGIKGRSATKMRKYYDK